MPAAPRWLPGALGALALAAAGCGGGNDGPRTDLKTPGEGSPRGTPTPTQRQPAKARGKVDPRHARVIRGWADTLRRGDVAGAARYFALPSIVSNNTPPIRLTTRADVRTFNRTLPCGALVVALEPAPNGFVYATFRLTERPGRGTCGSGTGGTARAAFRIRKGHITDWLRVPDAPPPPDTTPKS